MVDEVRQAVTAAGYQILAERPEPEAGWEAYFAAQKDRIAALRAEIAAGREGAGRWPRCSTRPSARAQQWRTLKREVGYYAVVARPE